MDDAIRNEITTKLTVRLWPTTGRALGLSKNSTYSAAASGEITTIKIGSRIVVPTAPLRKLLGIEAA